jgi:hypothetical protein
MKSNSSSIKYQPPPKFNTSLLKEFSEELNVSVWHTRALEGNRPTGGELGV